MNRLGGPVGSGFPLAGGNCNGLHGGPLRIRPPDRRAGIRASTAGAGCLTGVLRADSVSVHRRGGSTGCRQAQGGPCATARHGGFRQAGSDRGNRHGNRSRSPPSSRCSRTVLQVPAMPRPPPGRTVSCASKGGGWAAYAAARSGSRAAADIRATADSMEARTANMRRHGFAVELLTPSPAGAGSARCGIRQVPMGCRTYVVVVDRPLKKPSAIVGSRDQPRRAVMWDGK